MNHFEQNKLLIGALIESCKSGDEEQLKAQIETDHNLLHVRDQNGRTLLHYCAEHRTSAIAELLINKRPHLLTAQDDDGYTALHLTAICGNTSLLVYFTRRGKDLLNNDEYPNFLNTFDNENHTAFHWATVCGEIECLQILFEAGADPSLADIHGAHPIHYAAQNSNINHDKQLGLRILEKILKFAPNERDCIDKDGRAPLLWAASSANSEGILALVNFQADVSLQDKDGLTALHCASSRGYVEAIETLLSLCGAEIDQMDNNGCSALFYSVTLGHADCTQFLLQNGAEPNRQDRKGRSAAHCGAAKGQLETIKLLAQHGANLWMRNIRGDLPLHEAVRSGRKELVRWLLEQLPSTVNVSNTFGRSPLHVASISNNVEMCKVLIDSGADVNSVMKHKGHLLTPLDAALQRGYRSCAKFLLLHGALPSSKLNNPRGPLQRFGSKSSLEETGESNTSHEVRQESHSVSLTLQTESSQSALHEVRLPSVSRVKGRVSSSHEIQVFENGYKSLSPCTCVTSTTDPELRAQSIVTNVYVTTNASGRKRQPLKKIKRKKVRKTQTVITTEATSEAIRNDTNNVTTDRFIGGEPKSATNSEDEITGLTENTKEQLLINGHANGKAETHATETSEHDELIVESRALSDSNPNNNDLQEGAMPQLSRKKRSLGLENDEQTVDKVDDPGDLTMEDLTKEDIKALNPLKNLIKKKAALREAKAAEAKIETNEVSTDEVKTEEPKVPRQESITEIANHVAEEVIAEVLDKVEANAIEGKEQGQKPAVDEEDNFEVSEDHQDISQQGEGADGQVLQNLEVQQRDDVRTDTTLANVPDLTDDEEGHGHENVQFNSDEASALGDSGILKTAQLNDDPDSRTLNADNETDGNNNLKTLTDDVRPEEHASDGENSRDMPSLGSENSLQESVSVIGDDEVDEDIIKETVRLLPGEKFRSATTFEFRDDVDHEGGDEIGPEDSISRAHAARERVSSESRCSHKLHFRQTLSGIGPIDVSHVTAKINTRGSVQPGTSNSKRRGKWTGKWTGLSGEAESDFAHETLTTDVEKMMRKYQTERKLFEELQELKRCQIRSNRAHETLLVKRLCDKFEREARVPGMNIFAGPFDYKTYEKFLYDQLRKLSRSNKGKMSLIRSTSEDDIFGAAEVHMPQITLNRQGSRSVDILVARDNVYSSNQASMVKALGTSPPRHSSAKQTVEITFSATNGPEAETGEVAKKQATSHQARKSNVSVQTQNFVRRLSSSSSSRSSSSRIPVMKRRPSFSGHHSKPGPPGARRTWRKECCKNNEPVQPLDVALNRPKFRRIRMSIPPRPKLKVDEGNIAKRWEEIKQIEKRRLNEDRTLRKTISSPQLNEVSLLYEVNLDAKDDGILARASSCEELRVH